MEIYNHNWHFWKFHPVEVTQDMWKNLDRQKQFIDWLEKKLCIISKDHWIFVTAGDVIQHGGQALLSLYANSLFTVLRNVKGIEIGMSSDFWATWDNRKWFFDNVASRINVHNLSDWYTVNPTNVIERGWL